MSLRFHPKASFTPPTVKLNGNEITFSQCLAMVGRSEFGERPLPGFELGPVVHSSSAITEDHRIGHRARLKQRFQEGGADAIPDYELVELLLFRSIPRKDVKALAKELLKSFGDFAGVLSASRNSLLTVKGIGETTVEDLKLVEAAGHRLAKTRVMQKEVISSWDKLIDYCQARMAGMDHEEFRILFLDKRNRLIADECQQSGTIDHVAVYPREVVRRALELNATALILVHNHPSGDPNPSDGDIDMTRRLQSVLSSIGIVLHDHLIVAKSGVFSFASENLI